MSDKKAVLHLPGLFEFGELYRIFLALRQAHPEYFDDRCEIGSLYGASADCLWGGGRVGFGDSDVRGALEMTEAYGISARLTFSNSLLREEHLSDRRCNRLCEALSRCKVPGGVIVHSELLTRYLRETYPNLYLVSSTTKVLTDFGDCRREMERPEFRFVVPDFRLNNRMDLWQTLPLPLRGKAEFLCNECCDVGCTARKACYENVSRKSLGEPCPDHVCRAPGGQEGYRFSRAMASPAFIGTREIFEAYLPMGYTQFKIEGRGLGSAMILEFLLYYLVRPEYRIHVREAVYLDGMLDLF